MSLLEVEGVSKSYRRGHRERRVLRDVSLHVDPGEIVCVQGAGHSGRTTLLRIAAGVEPPDAGVVRFAGVDLRRAPHSIRRQVVFDSGRFDPMLGTLVVEQVMSPLLAVGVSFNDARIAARRALERVGAGKIADAGIVELIPEEAIRVALARAIARQPRLVLIDEPTSGLDILERDPLLRLIQSLAREAGTAFVTTAGQMSPVTGAERILRLVEGELNGRTAPTRADVLPFPPQDRSAESST